MAGAPTSPKSELLAVADAQARLLDGVAPVEAETVALAEANRRVLAEDLVATRTQPPFAASAMDGYAVRHADLALDVALRLVGEAPAGRAFAGTVDAGECVRIFTGAPLPAGADTVLIQEDAAVAADGGIRPTEIPAPGRNVRAAGLDFAAGDRLLRAGQRLDYRALALAAAMNHATIPVRRRPRVAILATGDELVEPGATPRPDQIVASNAHAIAALVEDLGGTPLPLGIAPDRADIIAARAVAAVEARADVLVTLGGASVGDHDLVQRALAGEGLQLGFWKIAMRPGKPLMSGRLGPTRVLGLPGNPVSSLVTAILFLKPLLRALLGEPTLFDPEREAILAGDLKPNDRRQDYLRARIVDWRDGLPVVEPLALQDSSMLSSFAAADCLIVRPPNAPALAAGAGCRIVLLG